MTRRGVRIFATIALGVLCLTAAPVQAARDKDAALILDADTGTILYEMSADAPRHPASLTKIMTLYMLFEAVEKGRLSLSDKLKVSSHAAAQPPSKLGLRTGTTIKVEDAVRALVTKSANDVAVVVAEAIGGSEDRFARQMTDRARSLGMRDTTFRNASGLHDPRQITTAYDLATLALAIRRDFPKEYAYFSTPTFTWKGVTHRNHNKLLGAYEGTDGIKTGYIQASGFNLVASVVRDGRRLIGVVMGGDTGARRDHQMKRLLDTGFTKAGEIRVAKVVPPMPLPRPARGVELAAADIGSSVVSTEAAATLPPLAVSATPETEVGSLDDGIGWGVQVGAYMSEARAQRSIATARGHLSALLTDADESIEILERRTGAIYRARLFGLTEQEARDACVALKRHQLPCVPVPGRAETATATAAGAKG